MFNLFNKNFLEINLGQNGATAVIKDKNGIVKKFQADYKAKEIIDYSFFQAIENLVKQILPLNIKFSESNINFYAPSNYYIKKPIYGGKMDKNSLKNEYKNLKDEICRKLGSSEENLIFDYRDYKNTLIVTAMEKKIVEDIIRLFQKHQLGLKSLVAENLSIPSPDNL